MHRGVASSGGGPGSDVQPFRRADGVVARGRRADDSLPVRVGFTLPARLLVGAAGPIPRRECLLVRRMQRGQRVERRGCGRRRRDPVQQASAKACERRLRRGWILPIQPSKGFGRSGEIPIVDLKIGEKEKSGRCRRANGGVALRDDLQRGAARSAVSRLDEEARSLIVGEGRKRGIVGDRGVDAERVGCLSRTRQRRCVAHAVGRAEGRRSRASREPRDRARNRPRAACRPCDHQLICRKQRTQLINDVDRLARLRAIG